MAYTAEIQVAVKGAKQLQDLASAIQKTSTEIDRLNRDIKTLSEGGLPRTISNLSGLVREAADAFNNVALNTREAADAARAYVNATNALNTGLEERSALLDKISRQERAAAMVRTGITMPTQQLMLPSSEMLQAGKRGLQQLSSYYGDINVEIDAGVQSGRAFTEQLAQSASAAETLPPIFNQVQQALQATAKATADGGAVQTSWLKVLSEFPRIQADILKNQIAEIRLNKESLNVDYARLEARKRMQRIQEFEAGQQTRAQRTQQLNESLALGVGFPLLFGGGVGTVAGSFAGSFAGKGFGGQIIGGALGQVAENTIRSIAQITSSLETIVAAAGIAGTATEKYIETLKKAGKEEEALAVATAALANVVGQDGVKALKDFEAAGTSLSNSLTQLATQLAAKAAQALGGPAGGITGALEESALFGQAQQSTDAQQIANFTKLARVYGQEYYDTLDAIYQRQRAINAEVEKNLADNKEIVTARQVDLNALGAELDLAKTNGNILNDNVYRLKEKVIEQRTYVALQDALEKGLETETILLREQIELQQLRREREEAATRAAEQNRQKIAEAFKAQNQALRELYTAQKTYNDFVVQQVQLRDGPTAAIEKQLSLLETMQVKDLQILNTERQQALNEAEKTNTVAVVNALYDQRLKNLNAQYAVQKDQLTLDYNRAQLTKQLAAQARRESVQSAVDPIRQQQFRTEIGIEKFTTPQNAIDAQNLALEQRLRLYNTELPILNEINRINTEIQSGALNEEALATKTLDLETQQQKLAAVKEELILLDALEQKQLKLQQFFNTYGQLIQSVSGEIANAVTFGVSEMVRGTKTAEQVFADFLQAIGNALIQQAQTMIATYIAIGIARIFAGMGGGGGGGGSVTPFAGGPATGGTTNTFAYGAGAPTFFSGRADGGSVRAATPYLVGERGPELFVPGMNGGVMSNSDLRSSMGAAPGSAAGAPVLNMSFETSTINGVEYVSRDQLEAAMAQTRRQAARDGAQRGMSMTLDKLQQSPSTRKRVGF